MGEWSIGEVSRRTGVAVETLRAWERRYQLLEPRRTAGGHRRYGEIDVARVLHAKRLVEGGLPISVAVRRISSRPSAAHRRPTRSFDRLVREAWSAIERMDAIGFDELLLEGRREVGLARMLDGFVVPILHRLGAEWRTHPRTVAREHATSSVVRTHLLQYIRDLPGTGALCVVACPDGELHDLGPIMAGATLVEVGWRAVVLGASTPWQSTEAIVSQLEPALVLVGVERPPRRPVPPPSWQPPGGTHVILGGAGATALDLAGRPDVHVHDGLYADLPSFVASLPWNGR